MAEYLDKTEFQASRAFSPAVITQGGKTVWLAGQTATQDEKGNDISGNFYTGTVGIGPTPGGQNPPGWQYVSAGLLLYVPGTVWHANNHYAGNQRNVAMYP